MWERAPLSWSQSALTWLGQVLFASAHVKQNSEASPMGEDHGLWFSEYHAIVIEHLNLAR